jgi:hypothetical protein
VARVQEGYNLTRGIITNTSLLCKIFISRRSVVSHTLHKFFLYSPPTHLIPVIESGYAHCWKIQKFYIICLQTQKGCLFRDGKIQYMPARRPKCKNVLISIILTYFNFVIKVWNTLCMFKKSKTLSWLPAVSQNTAELQTYAHEEKLPQDVVAKIKLLSLMVNNLYQVVHSQPLLLTHAVPGKNNSYLPRFCRSNQETQMMKQLLPEWFNYFVYES